MASTRYAIRHRVAAIKVKRGKNMTTDHMALRKLTLFSNVALSSKTIKSEFTDAKRSWICTMTLAWSTDESILTSATLGLETMFKLSSFSSATNVTNPLFIGSKHKPTTLKVAFCITKLWDNGVSNMLATTESPTTASEELSPRRNLPSMNHDERTFSGSTPTINESVSRLSPTGMVAWVSGSMVKFINSRMCPLQTRRVSKYATPLMLFNCWSVASDIAKLGSK